MLNTTQSYSLSLARLSFLVSLLLSQKNLCGLEEDEQRAPRQSTLTHFTVIEVLKHTHPDLSLGRCNLLVRSKRRSSHNQAISIVFQRHQRG